MGCFKDKSLKISVIHSGCQVNSVGLAVHAFVEVRMKVCNVSVPSGRSLRLPSLTLPVLLIFKELEKEN